MKLEVGKRYKTRNGRCVVIERRMDNRIYRMLGRLVDSNIIEWWREDGRFSDDPHNLDIIEEVKEQPMPLPFTIEKAKLGNEVMLPDGTPVDLISDRQDGRGKLCVLDKETQEFRLVKASSLGLRPVALVEGKPVLIGDKVVWVDGKEHTITAFFKSGNLHLSNHILAVPRNLKLTKKTKWINLSRTEDNRVVAEEYENEEEANSNKRATHFLQTEHEV